MISKAFARACREACRRFGGKYRGYRTSADFGPKGLEKLRKRMPGLAGRATHAESCNT